ncbi:UNVERIFIED_CONTAM: MitHPPK/DHPS [Trichonephila clavipes]
MNRAFIDREDLHQALETLKAGGIILYPTDTIWGLGCDATNPEAVEKIFALKGRDKGKSMIVLLANDNQLQSYVKEVPEVAYELIEASDKPLTIIYSDAKNLAENVIAEDGSIGIRIVNHPFCEQLIQRFRKPIVSTSANISGQPSAGTFDEIDPEIRKAVDYVVKFGQDNHAEGKASTIMKLDPSAIFVAVFAMISISQAQQAITPAKVGVNYGKKIDKKGAISVKQLEQSFAKAESFNGKIEGEVVQVCKKKGCFLTIKRAGDQEPIMVRFTDYAYFVPEDLVGKTVVVEGKAKVKETTVEWQKHYAEDMGKSKEEIAKITKPRKDISVVADGVLVVNCQTIQINGQLMDFSRPKIMGILNVTPDSFFDGGKHYGLDEALRHTERLLSEGADIIDLGAYSSRPGAKDISAQEEMDRAIPVIEGIRSEFPDAFISVDTFRAEVARASVQAGGHIINDIGGGTLDPLMFETVAELQVPYILMHMRGTPSTMQQLTSYEDVVNDVAVHLGNAVAQLRALGTHWLEHSPIQEEFLRQLMVDRLRSTVIYVERDPELLEALLDLKVVFINDLLWSNAFFFGFDGNGCTMFIRTTDINHILLVQT